MDTLYYFTIKVREIKEKACKNPVLGWYWFGACLGLWGAEIPVKKYKVGWSLLPVPWVGNVTSN